MDGIDVDCPCDSSFSDRDIANTFTESRLRRHRRHNTNGNQASAGTSADRVARTGDSYDPYKDTAAPGAGLDKPPEYFELFPASSTTKISSDPAVAMATADDTNLATETTPIIQTAPLGDAMPADSHVIHLDEPQTQTPETGPPTSTINTTTATGGRLSKSSNRKPADV